MCGRGGIGRRASFRYSYLRVWEFKSPRPHLGRSPAGFLYLIIYIIKQTLILKIVIIYFGLFYILLGGIFLLIPILYLELGRSKDLFIAALSLLTGVILVIKYKVFDNLYLAIQFLFIGLVVLFVAEIFLSRWNQLTDKEKSKLTTLIELKKNLSKISDAIILGLNNTKKPLNFLTFKRIKENINKKMWVRNDKNDSVES